jgi:hypothetical protein
MHDEDDQFFRKLKNFVVMVIEDQFEIEAGEL